MSFQEAFSLTAFTYSFCAWVGQNEERNCKFPFLFYSFKEVSLCKCFLDPSNEKREHTLPLICLNSQDCNGISTTWTTSWAHLAQRWPLTHRNSPLLSSWCSYNWQEGLVLRWKIYLQPTVSNANLRTLQTTQIHLIKVKLVTLVEPFCLILVWS